MDMREGPVDANALQALRGAAEELPVAPESVQGDGEATSSQGRVLFYAANNGMEGPAHPGPPIVAAGNEDLGAMRMEDDDDNSSEALPRRVVEKKTVTKGNYNYPKCQFEGCGKIRTFGFGLEGDRERSFGEFESIATDPGGLSQDPNGAIRPGQSQLFTITLATALAVDHHSGMFLRMTPSHAVGKSQSPGEVE